MKKTITITNKEAQEIAVILCQYPEKEMFSRCKDILVDKKGEYNHYVAHEITKKAKDLKKNGRGKVATKNFKSKANEVAFMY